MIAKVYKLILAILVAALAGWGLGSISAPASASYAAGIAIALSFTRWLKI